MAPSFPLPIAIAMTCHNRREKTESCIRSILDLPEIAQGAVRFHLFLCDDGSTDGTADMARGLLGDQVTIIHGDGNLFWNRGMVKALSFIKISDYSGILLLNDDVRLHRHAWASLSQTNLHHSEVAVVSGATEDQGGKTTYGGFRRGPWWNRLRMTVVKPGPVPQAIDTCNCNIVWVPAAVAMRTVILDPVFIHAMGDIDYGFRLRALGIPLLLCAGHVGCCEGNPRSSLIQGFMNRVRFITGPKHLPLRPWTALCHRHAGILWPLLLIFSYAKFIYHGR